MSPLVLLDIPGRSIPGNRLLPCHLAPPSSNPTPTEDHRGPFASTTTTAATSSNGSNNNKGRHQKRLSMVDEVLPALLPPSTSHTVHTAHPAHQVPASLRPFVRFSTLPCWTAMAIFAFLSAMKRNEMCVAGRERGGGGGGGGGDKRRRLKGVVGGRWWEVESSCPTRTWGGFLRHYCSNFDQWPYFCVGTLSAKGRKVLGEARFRIHSYVATMGLRFVLQALVMVLQGVLEYCLSPNLFYLFLIRWYGKPGF